ncbi:hypothetical protein M569_09487, partial [Genlisea aurea]
MDLDMEVSPSYSNPEDLSSRERYRRYGKRQTSSSLTPPQHHDGSSTSRFSSAALFLENVKQEIESLDMDTGLTPFGSASKRRGSIDRGDSSGGVSDGARITWSETESIKICKQEQLDETESADSIFSLFASVLDSGLQGRLIPMTDLILRFENSCRSVSESISRFGAKERHRIVEDILMRKKAQQLLDEAASWSLLWYLYGKGNEDFPEELVMSPVTSHLEASQFVAVDHDAQLCLRIVQWLEGLASKALDLDSKIRGTFVGTCLSSSGFWNHTQRQLKMGTSNAKTVRHLDFDAPTREHAHQLPDDKKQDESLMEDIWTLLRAGRLEEAYNLSRAAGQPWRAASLRPFGGVDMFPSLGAIKKNGKNRMLQAIELESGIGHQWHLWKWACFCSSE